MNNQFNGWLAEKATGWALSQSLDPQKYWHLDDVIIPNGFGGTAQLDHVVVSECGIFVIEVKNRNGVIYGRANESTWRQFSHGRTFEFYNPVLQNEGHIRAMVQLSKLRRWAFHSIVFFPGDVRFSNPMSCCLRTEGIVNLIQSKSKIILWPDEINYVWSQLWACKSDPALSTQNHLQYVHELRLKQTARTWPCFGV
jgi:hypothetical protein